MAFSNYNPPKPDKYNFLPTSKEPFKISRTGIELFISCPRCFYLEKRLGVARPPGYPFSLNRAVDYLLKKEFDIHRAQNKTHPLIQKYGIDAIPVKHKMLDVWRENFSGVRYFDKKTNLVISGAIDDLWQNNKTKKYHVVDYKATSRESEVNLDADWQISYKRQSEIYQWLLRKNDLEVSDIAYFVYCNGITDRRAFDGKLEFDIKIISYSGDDSWVQKAVEDIKTTLNSNKIPEAHPDCDYCKYLAALGNTNSVHPLKPNTPKKFIKGKLF